MKLFVYLLLLTSLMTNLYATEPEDDFAEIELDSFHLKEVVNDSEDSTFVPVEIKMEKPNDDQRSRGVVNRLIISYGQISAENFETTFESNNEDRGLNGNFDINRFNEIMKEELKLRASHIITIEYFITDALSIELGDTYREQGMDRTQVGEYSPSSGGGNLLGGGGSTSTPYYMDHEDRTHDITLGLGYTVKVMDNNFGKIEITFKGNAGLVHMDTRTEVDYGTPENYVYEYEGLAGYSLGAGVRARYSYKNFFIQGGVDYKNYVIAPMEHSDGSTSQINQRGFMAYFGIGIRF